MSGGLPEDDAGAFRRLVVLEVDSSLVEEVLVTLPCGFELVL